MSAVSEQFLKFKTFEGRNVFPILGTFQDKEVHLNSARSTEFPRAAY